MPELPEVETIKRQLNQKVVGLVIKDLEVKNSRSFSGDPKQIIDAKIISVDRRAKMIIIGLTVGVRNSDYDLYLLIHLKMTGQLIYVDPTSPALGGLRGTSKNGQFGGGHPVPPFNTEVPNKHTRVIFDFADGSHLYFNDVRKFGWIKLVISNKVLEQELANLGPEPLNDDFTVEILKNNLLKRKNTAIKVALMDPSVVAGIGNIYAAEACFYAKIKPDRKVSSLGNQDFKNLYDAIRKILPLAIKYQGVSADNYVTLEGKMGNYYKKLWVYDREGELCLKCKGKISKITLGGRGTYYCKKCQR